IFSKIKQLVQKVRKGPQWANDNVYKLFIKPFAKPKLAAFGLIRQTIGKSLDVTSSFLDYGYEFEPPVPNVITKFSLSSQLERQSFLASSGSDPQLIIYGDRITLTASNAKTALFPSGDQLSGYLFKSYPPEARLKAGDQVIALVGTDASNAYNIFCYIDQKLAIYYKLSYESSRKINYEPNNDGNIDFMDTQNVNGRGQFEEQSYVYETVKKQTDLFEAGVQGLNKTNYQNSEIKLVDELAIYKAERATYFIKDGPFTVNSFGAKLAQLGANSDTQQTVYKLFSTISKNLLHPNTKYMPIRVEQQEFSAMFPFKNMYDKSSAVQVALSGKLSIVCVFNLYYESKWLQGRIQEVGRIHDSILPADEPQESIPMDSADVYKYCASGMYYL
ncbi:MAG: hypothetical protein EZS28_034127, partial [Streblomastix strix]